MHELSTCKSIIRQIENSLGDHPHCEIKRVTLLIGELARVDEKELAELFPIAAKSTIAENAELIIKNDPAKYTCNECNRVTSTRGSHIRCTFCHSTQLTLTSGTEMMLENIELVEQI